MNTVKSNNLTKVFTLLAIVSLVACTKLDPKLEAPLSIAPTSEGGAPSAPSISSVYEQLNQLVGQYGYQAMQEHSTDELMGPTRGTDWDDFGTWRRLHLHTWAGDHNQINDVWNGLNGALFQTTLIAETKSGLEKAEGQFLRGFFRFLTCDLYGQVQSRPATAAANAIPTVLTRAQVIDEIITDLSVELCGLFYADRLTIYLTSDDKGSIISKVKTGLHSFKDIKLPVNEQSVAGFVGVNKRVVNIRDVYDDFELKEISPQLNFLKAVDAKTGYRTKQMVEAPILEATTRDLIGIIQIINTKNGQAFPPYLEEGVLHLCETLAIAFRQRQGACMQVRGKTTHW